MNLELKTASRPGKKRREFLRHNLRVIHSNNKNSIVCSIQTIEFVFYVFMYLTSTGTKISQNVFQYAAVLLDQKLT